MKQTWDFSKYHKETNKTLAARYGYSKNTFKKNIEGINDELDAMRKALRPSGKRGSNFWTIPMLQLLFDHMGFEPPLPLPQELGKKKKADN
ncbi:MAG: hypothetical protein AB7G44_10170 [Bacteroidia bacterium]